MASTPWEDPLLTGAPVASQDEVRVWKQRAHMLLEENKRLKTINENIMHAADPQRFVDMEKAIRKLQRENESLHTRLRERRGPDLESSVSQEEFVNTLSVGQMVDAVDTENQWLPAVVTAMTKIDAQVQFHGFGPQFRTWIPKNSGKLKPLGTETNPLGKTRSYHEIGASEAKQLRTDNSRLRVERDTWRGMVFEACGERDALVIFGLYEQAFRLQEDVEHCIRGMLSTLDMEKKLNDVEQRLRQLENAFDGTSLQILRYCSRVLRQHRNRLGEHATELKKVPVVENERNYAQMLQRHFYTLKSPSSGECLFLAFAKAQMVYSYRVKFPQVKLDVVLERVHQSMAELSRTASLLRGRVMKHIGLCPDVYGESIVNTLQRALKGEDQQLDSTSLKLKQSLKERFPLHPEKHVDTPEARDVYIETLKQETVYASFLELRALSDIFQVPVDVYMYQDQKEHTASSAPDPAITVGGQHTMNAEKRISLLCYVMSKHFDLLVPRPEPTVSSPVHSSAAPQARGRRRPVLTHQRSVSPGRRRGPPVLLKERSRYDPEIRRQESYEEPGSPGDDADMASDAIVETSMTPAVTPAHDSDGGGIAPNGSPHARQSHATPPPSPGLQQVSFSPLQQHFHGMKVTGSPHTERQVPAPLQGMQPVSLGFSQVDQDARRAAGQSQGSQPSRSISGHGSPSRPAQVEIHLVYKERQRALLTAADQPLGDLMQRVAKANKVKPELLTFQHSGREISPSQTPRQLGLKNGDMIYVGIRRGSSAASSPQRGPR